MEWWDKLAEYEDGWMDGEGKAPTRAAIYVARAIAGRIEECFGGHAVGFPLIPDEPFMNGGVFVEFLGVDAPDGMEDCDVEVGPDGLFFFGEAWTAEQRARLLGRGGEG